LHKRDPTAAITVVNFHNSLYYVWAYLFKSTALGLIRIRVYYKLHISKTTTRRQIDYIT